MKVDPLDINKWENVYWFSRMLINNDKYGSIGSENELLATLSSSLRLIRKENKNISPEKLLMLQKKVIKNKLIERFKNARTRKNRVEKFLEDINKEIKNGVDMDVFILTCEHIMMPINQALKNIPNNDKEFTESISRSYLEINGEKALATVITLWDDLGVKGSLTAERTEIIKAFATLRTLLAENNNFTEKEQDIVKTAFVQEFERRVAQKRKSRAGTSLEDATTLILDYFGIKSVHPPEHFQSDIEIDKWVRTKDSWLIGISCKRTLRERWKQVSSASKEILSKYKIKFVYHILTYDEDLSDDKLTQLGMQRHIFYLPDGSRILQKAKDHVGLKEYVRPISGIIKDLNAEIK